MPNSYAGIGSRETPEDILEIIIELAKKLSHDGWILRSGHARGADQAFEKGAQGKAEIYLPWPSFEKDVPIQAQYIRQGASIEAWEMASKFHPAWKRLSPGARTLHARNCHQVLGKNLDDPVEAIVCWTSRGMPVGGTAQALRIAYSLSIRVFNLGTQEGLEWAKELI